jgi:hypothetical protein
MAQFDPEVNPVVSHVTLMEQAIGVRPLPQAYLCCANKMGQTRIFCVHLPSHYTAALDGNATPWDGLSFAFLGDAIQGHTTTVILPDTSFRLVANVRSKTADFIVTNLDQCGAYGFPPALIDDQDTTVVSSRHMMYLPARYASLFLSPLGYSLRKVWEGLYPAIVNVNDLQPCHALINWLRVVSMGTQSRNMAGPTTAIVELQAPLADENLINHCLRLQKLTLPGLYKPQESLERVITQMAVAITQSTNDSRMAHEEKAARQDEPKLLSDRFTVTLGILQSYLQVEDEINLPPLWHQLANCTKRQEFNVLSNMLQSHARSPDAFSTCAPIASAKALQDVLNFTFVSETTDDIKTGIQPFIIADASAEHRQINL